MTDANINPQNIPTQPPDPNLTEQKPPSLNSKKFILLAILMFLIISGLFSFWFFNQTEKSTKPDITTTVTPQISKTISGQPTPSLEAQITPEFVPDEVIVKYKSGQSPDEIEDENEKKQLENRLKEIGMISQEKLYNSEDADSKRYYLLKLAKSTDVLKTVNLLLEFKEIEYAEPNDIQKIF